MNSKNQNFFFALYPFAVLYGCVVTLRNWMFDNDIIKSEAFDIPIISVGNLSVGGTGKTPHTEYILRLLQHNWKTAMLSRGYKRKSKGFYLANEKSQSRMLGDEPFQIHRKFPKVTVAVDEKRVRGVQKLLKMVPDLQAIVLDDAYQHRYIRPGFSVLLTDYSKLYTRDHLLPAGRLREWRNGYKRADIIIVTKCPADAKPIDLRLIATEIKPSISQLVLFSSYEYDEIAPVFPEANPESWTYQRLQQTEASILLVAGIVSPQAIVEHLQPYCKDIKTAFYADHHAFRAKDFAAIGQKFDTLSHADKILLVTEKDAARLIGNPHFPEALKSRTFALPIRVKILQNQEDIFIQKIKTYVAENSRNR